MAIAHDLPLVSTIAMGLSTAFVLGLIATRLRLPPIVGYLLAGIVIGPHTPGFVGDQKIAEELSEIGIVLLMFGVGLHFSLKDLMDVRRVALPGAIVQITVATALGAAIAHYWWEWSWVSGLMFGLALSVASTVVLIRALEENNLMQTIDGRIAIGWLIVEDLAMVLALVLVPALAEAQSSGGGWAEVGQKMAMALAMVVLFVGFMLVAGRTLLPKLLSLTARTGSRELFTLAVFAVAMGVAYGAAKLFGVSFALGAFFAGMMIRESDMNHEVASRALPFQDAFAVLFFVAVGMLFNPMILFEEPLRVLVVVAIIMVGKSLAAFVLVLALGYPLRTGLLVSAGLAQIGEFSFILVALGISLGLLTPEGQSLLLAGAMISIALNPITFYGSRFLYSFAGRHPAVSRLFKIWPEDELACLTGAEKQELKDLVILAGAGLVGRLVSENIRRTHIDLVVIEASRERVEQLREQGYHALAGDAGHAETLLEANIEKAAALVVAVPDAFEARRIVEAARALRPTLKIIVRAHNEEEHEYFMAQNVDFTVTGPRAMAHDIAEYVNRMKIAP